MSRRRELPVGKVWVIKFWINFEISYCGWNDKKQLNIRSDVGNNHGCLCHGPTDFYPSQLSFGIQFWGFLASFWNIFLIFAYVFLRLKMKWTDFGSQLLLMNQINYSNEVSTMWFTRCRESIHSKPENQVKNEFLTNFELTPNYTSPKP